MQLLILKLTHNNCFKTFMELKRVVVTGLGALTPIGNTVPEYWNGLLDGVSGGALIAAFDASRFKSQIACEVKNFDVNTILDRKEARKYDKFSQYALAVAKEAVEDAAFDLDKVKAFKSKFFDQPDGKVTQRFVEQIILK